jgi:flagellar hook-associated protein FlgK
MQGTNQVNEINVIAQKIEIVQEQIKSKDELIEFYKSKGWGNSAKKQSDEKDALVKELMKLKDQQIEGKNQEVSDIVQYKTWAKAFFRVVLILMSVLISRRLFSL